MVPNVHEILQQFVWRRSPYKWSVKFTNFAKPYHRNFKRYDSQSVAFLLILRCSFQQWQWIFAPALYKNFEMTVIKENERKFHVID